MRLMTAPRPRKRSSCRRSSTGGSIGPTTKAITVTGGVTVTELIAPFYLQAKPRVEGGAEGVGQATTSSVVWSILSMLVANAMLTAFFYFVR